MKGTIVPAVLAFVAPAVSAATRNLLAPVPAPDSAFGPALAPAPFGEMESIMNGEPDSGEFDMPDPTGDLESVS